MRRRAFIALSAVVAVATAATFACGSFGDASDDAPDGGAPDGPAAGDALVRDETSSGGAGVDAAVGQHRCPGEEKIFDRFGRPLPAGANGWQLAPDASLAVLADAGAAPPVLFASAPLLSSGDKVTNTMSREFQLGTDSLVCVELDMLLEQVEGTFTVDSFAEIFDVHATNTTSVFVEFDPTGLAFTQDKTHVPIPGVALGQWQHFVVRIPYGTTEHPSLEIDGQPSVAGFENAGAKPSQIRIELGVAADSRTGKTAAVRAYLDNVRVTTAP